MNSWDLFDTLIARWDRDPKVVFDAIAYQSGVNNFTLLRKESEEFAKVKTLDGIYDEMHKRAPKLDIGSLKEMELKYELEHTFPIMENVLKMKPSDIIITDMYLPRNFLYQLLDLHGIKNFADVLISYNGKYTGEMWESLKVKPELHIGDNHISDVQMPRKCGIKAMHYVDKPSYTEGVLRSNGYDELTRFVRVLRLSNPGDEFADLWQEQATVNIPVLVLASIYTIQYYGNRKFLFATRETTNLKEIFDAMYPSVETHVYYTSRKCLREPSSEFLKYAREMLKDNPVVVDSHGSGITSNQFYDTLGTRPDMFFVVGTDFSRKFKKYNAIVKRKSGLWVEIEDMNQGLTGSIIGVKDGKPIFDKIKYDPSIVEHQMECAHRAASLIKQGFPLPTQVKDNLPSCLRDILLQVRNHRCAIHQHGIPHINDWPLTQEAKSQETKHAS